MSWLAAPEPLCVVPAKLDVIVVPRAKDLGGFQVRRVLPSVRRRMVGPFIFLDQMGPAEFPPGHGIDVRPHPHIGLATVTYLFEGEIMHRDSLGVVQPIRPGAINLMTAGKGIVHSERTGSETRAAGHRLSGMQSWIALPKPREEMEPAFSHHPADGMPEIEGEGVALRLLMGSLFGRTAPVPTYSDTIYADVHLSDGARLDLPPEIEERGIYLFAGSIRVAGEVYAEPQLLVLKPGGHVVIEGVSADANFMVLGGASMDGPRHIWWNLVHSDPERIEAAKEDWKLGRFPSVPGEHEFIPLPEM